MYSTVQYAVFYTNVQYSTLQIRRLRDGTLHDPWYRPLVLRQSISSVYEAETSFILQSTTKISKLGIFDSVRLHRVSFNRLSQNVAIFPAKETPESVMIG